MNILSKVTWQAMWKNKIRTIVTIIGIILSAAMFMAVLTLALSLRDFLLRGCIYERGDWHVRFHYSTDEQLTALKADERVSSVVNVQAHGYFSVTYPGEEENYTNTYFLGSAEQDCFDSMPIHLLEGRLPQNSSELVVSEYILTRLNGSGKAVQIGDTIELALQTVPEYLKTDLPETEPKQYAKSYTIVGTMEDLNSITGLSIEAALTVSDGGEPETLWNYPYAKAQKMSDAYILVGEEYGLGRYVNTDVLMFSGISRYGNVSFVFGGICAVLIGIIMIGSISLIYNAFSISVSERTKQFGLLSSVGATRKQIRRSVLFEAAALCLISIPLGLLSGWGSIAVVLRLLDSFITGLFAFGLHVPLLTVFSLPGTLCAAAIGILTVFISAAIPSIRATRVSPVAAIRESADYKARAKDVKVSKLTYKLFGLPGAMAKKYYRVSRRKYRSTVISLTVSVVLFISAASLGTAIRETASETTEVHNYDFVCAALSEERLQMLQELAEMDAFEDVVWMTNNTFFTVLPLTDIDEDFAAFHTESNTEAISESHMIPDVNFSYIEDSKLRAWLENEGLDPEPYFNAEDPTALVLELSNTVFTYNEDGAAQRHVQTAYPVRDTVIELALYPNETAGEDWLLNGTEYEDSTVENFLTADGQVYAHVIPREEFDPLWIEGIDRNDIMADPDLGVFFLAELSGGELRYYLYDPVADTAAAEPYASMPVDIPSVRLGQRVSRMELADASTDFYRIQLILPLSLAPENGVPILGLNVKMGCEETVRTFLNDHDAAFNDYLEAEQEMRGTLLVIDVFSYGFIILISLICIANVFNTVSTNIALRRRDFGMLRSVGMKTGELYRMMNYECLIYGSKALLWGLPISLLISYGVHRLVTLTYVADFAPPWSAIAIAAACVFLVVFSSMFYAVSKLRRDTPIDAIRMENL